MRYFLSARCALRRLEFPAVYDTASDEIYELDEEAFSLLTRASSVEGVEQDESGFFGFCVKEGVLAPENPASKRPLARQSLIPSLRYLELLITDRCNLRCRHCYIGEPLKKDLPADDVKTILRDFEDSQGLRVLISGGEPIMHPDFDKINEMLPDFTLRKILFTNGMAVTKKLASRLNVNEVQISIDGLDEAHDYIRGQGSFKQAVGAMGILRDAGLEVSVSTMIHARNLGDFDKLNEMFLSMGVRDWTVDAPCTSGRLADNPELCLPPEVAGPYLKYGFGDGLHGGGPEGYGCGAHLLSVMPDGSCAKCAFYSSNPSGHFRDGLSACHQRVGPIMLSELECDCSHINECRGGCRYRAGGGKKKDFYKCALYDNI